MKIHSLQHVPFEDLGNIENWVVSKGHSISRTLLFNGGLPPNTDSFDWLIILGGPMNVYEEIKYPWLAVEKIFIEETIRKGKLVLGICLGAQLIADVLGGQVIKNACKEIGWHPVTLANNAKSSAFFGSLPPKFPAFHWHGDTFSLPPGAKHMAKSKGCKNQAFEYEGRVVGLQFHLESSLFNIKRLIDNCTSDLEPGKFVQKPAEMLQTKQVREIKTLLEEFLNKMSQNSVTVA